MSLRALMVGLFLSPAVAFGASTGSITGEVTAASPKLRTNVVVYLEKVNGNFPPPSEPAQISQKRLMFSPHVLPVIKGTTVRFTNGDNVAHNVYSPDGDKYDLGSWPQGESKTYTFRKKGAFVQLCRLHPEMAAYVVVVDNPYFAVTGSDGRFRIDNVPPGSYTLRAWSERLPEASKTVTVAAGSSAEAHIELKR